jgi:hypothetical protein
MKKTLTKTRTTNPGPAPDRLKISMSFDEAAARVVKVPRPDKGWPKSVMPTKRKTKTVKKRK